MGNVYKINNFFITNNKQRYKIVSHIAMLQFVRSIIFKNVEEDIPEIPQHKFNFVEFDQLTSKVDINDLLLGKFKYDIHICLFIINKLIL